MAQYYPGEKPLLSLKYGTTTTPRTHSSDAKSLSTNAVATDMAIPSWLAERFANGAAALNLISTHTTIPVPRLKGWGRDHNGLCFFETERVLGSVRCDQTGDQCRMPQFHFTDGPCEDCWEIAYSPANKFVRETVLPQLRSLKSITTGLNGHNDLTANNIMLDSQTLEVKTLFDWEDSGYLPPKVQQLKYTRFDQFGLYEDMDTVRRYVGLIAT